MNTTKLLLIVGLVYISMNQTKDSTRNMMLFMTGLLGFCMLGKIEGYCIIPRDFLKDPVVQRAPTFPPGSFSFDGTGVNTGEMSAVAPQNGWANTQAASLRASSPANPSRGATRTGGGAAAEGSVTPKGMAWVNSHEWLQ